MKTRIEARIKNELIKKKGGGDCGSEKKEKEVRELLTDKSGAPKKDRFLSPVFLGHRHVKELFQKAKENPGVFV